MLPYTTVFSRLPKQVRQGQDGVLEMGTKVVEGRDMQWKVLEGAWVVGMRGLEFWCYTELLSD